MNRDVYITDLAGFLPNAPVDNDNVERVLGRVNGKPSRAMRITLRSNGIQLRHYAIDPATGKFTHTNARMTAEAVRSVMQRAKIPLDSLDLLCCGTSSPDHLAPAHASMVHGELKSPPCEVVSFAGICATGASALKYAYLNVAAGQAGHAVSSGSEFVSSYMRAAQFKPETDAMVAELEAKPELAFEKDFLRWMLSAGAGAALVRDKPNTDRLSLRIDWIDGRSFAGQLESCMYAGAVKLDDGSLRGWRELDDPQQTLKQGYFAVKQDVRLLNEHIVSIAVKDTLLPIAKQRGLAPDQVTWFLPHLSSEYFRPRLSSQMAAAGFDVPMERWFTNLSTTGNIGSAAVYIMLEELLYSGKLRRGDRLLCLVPESSRFSIYYIHLTVV
jgi:3-oxoacyl-[acyl-carrier-protein] synthase III